MKNLVKELEKLEKEKIKLRASEFGARRDREFYKLNEEAQDEI